MDLERRQSLTTNQFIQEYLAKNRPLIVTDAMDTWRGKHTWNPAFFREHFGSDNVQVYDDLFNIVDVMPLKRYLDLYFNKTGAGGERRVMPYVRWYSRLKKAEGFPWSDHVFAALRDQWSMPYFLPKSSYLLPFCSSTDSIDPNVALFPARGFFISAKGCRTRLHRDPWQSDAILCQIYGEKRIVIFSPDQAPFLSKGQKFVDVESPDLTEFPLFENAIPAIETVLRAGETLFLPSGWFHHVNTCSDSISLTWNFVHITTWQSFFQYLKNNPPASEMETISFFLNSRLM